MVPADAESRAAIAEECEVGPGARESAAVMGALGVRAPEKRAHVEPARRGAIEHVEERAGIVREAEIVRVESDGEPDAVAGDGDRGGDAAERGHAVDQRAHEIAGPRGIGAGEGGGHATMVVGRRGVGENGHFRAHGAAWRPSDRSHADFRRQAVLPRFGR